MVKELHVEDPHEKEVAWEDKVDAYYEMAFQGLPLPEKLQELHVEEFGHYTGDRDPAMVRAEKKWDSYMLAVDVQDSRTPRERLSKYFEGEEK